MEENKLLQDVTGTLTEEPINFTIDIYSRNKVHAWLQKKGWAKKKKEYSIKPITYGNMQRISAVMLTIESAETDTHLERVYTLMRDHSETVCRILAIAITNSRSGPPKGLAKEIFYNLTTNESLNLLLIVLKQINVSGFWSTITLVRGLNVSAKEKTKEPAESL